MTHGTYHVVCHDCAFEWVVKESGEAVSKTQWYEYESGHNTEYKKVD